MERREPRQLRNTEFLDEIIVSSNNGKLSIHVYFEERYKTSEASGNEWRFLINCDLIWNGKMVARWYSGDIRTATLYVAKYLDGYIHDKPIYKRDARLEWHEFVKNNDVRGIYYSDSSDDEIETDEAAVAYHERDEEILDNCNTSYKLNDRDDFLQQIASTGYSVDLRIKGFSVMKTQIDRNIFSALFYAGETKIEYAKFPNIENLCFQPGCPNPYTVEYTIKKREDYQTYDAYRRFCDDHRGRGDCGLDDANDNYDIYPPRL
jgi:hypothetical protein